LASGGERIRPDLAKQAADVGELKRLDVINVAIADLGLSKCAVLVDDVSDVPSREFADDADDAAGAVLPIVR
jgi:hypothetical protein